ncbi:MAG TPA: NIL domain-containing protein [Fimbriimonadaceae bacterium]|nr:NIL domain-containing protein [Fimbriimonadaceae bacterium]
MPQVQVNVTATGEQSTKPWLWQLCREFEVKVVVQRANIDADFGWACLQLDGATEEIQRATAWLMTTGMHVESLSRALGA